MSPPTLRVPLQPWLPWLALPLVAGAAGLAASHWWWIAIIAGTFTVLFAQRWPLAARFSLGLASFVIGAWISVPRASVTENVRVLTVHGLVSSAPMTGLTQGFVVAPTTTDDPEEYLPKRIFVRGPGTPGIQAGDFVTVRGLWSRDERGDQIQTQNIEEHIRREDGSRGFAWRTLGNLSENLELAGSLLLGVGNPPEKALFVRTGLIHVLAVSGVHLILAAALSSWILFRLGLPWIWRQVALGGLLIGYTWLTAASPATVRALIMALSFTVYSISARESYRLGAVSLAALLLVLWDPLIARDLGFQLSLLAVIGIMTLGLDLRELRLRYFPLSAWTLDRALWRFMLAICRSLADGIIIGFSATFATLPLLICTFGNCAPWSIITTLFVSPPTTLALWSGLPLLICGGLFPDGPWEGLYKFFELSLNLLVHLIKFADLLPGKVPVEFPPVWIICLWPLLFIPYKSNCVHLKYEYLVFIRFTLIICALIFIR